MSCVEGHGKIKVSKMTHWVLAILQIRDDVTQRALVAKRQVELKDMVIEDEVPNIGYAEFVCVL